MAPELQNLSPPDGDVLLKAIQLKHPSLVVTTMTGTLAVAAGENMMSVITRVTVFGHDLDTGAKVTLSLIMKRPPDSAERRQLFLCDAAFHNEATFYGEVDGKLFSSTVAPGLGKLPFPPCLLAADDVIVLSDLRPDGFVMADRRAGLDLDHCRLVLEELGRYHASSYTMKHLQPLKFHKMSSSINEVFIHDGNTILIGCIDHAIDMAVKASKNTCNPVVEKLNSLRGKGMEILRPHVIPEEPLAVICHGDFHSHNILFHYTNNNDVPDNVAFVDLQGCRYASPALDILYFIFTSGSPDVLKHHFKYLISSYHVSVKNQLTTLAPSATVPTFDEIMKEIKLRLDYGLVMAVLMLPMVSAEKVTFDLDKVSLETISEVQHEVESEMINDQYKQRVNDLFQLIINEQLVIS